MEPTKRYEPIKPRYSVRSKATGKVHTVRVDVDIAIHYKVLTGASPETINAQLKHLAHCAVVQYEQQDVIDGPTPVNWFMKSDMLFMLTNAARGDE